MIELIDCSAFLKNQEIVKGISLKIPKGAFFTIIGESGGENHFESDDLEFTAC